MHERHHVPAFFGGRQNGKTTELIRIAAKCQGYIVVYDRRRATHVHRMANRMGCSIPFPLTYNEVMRGEFTPFTGHDRPGCRALLFDDLDDFLHTLSRGTPIAGIAGNFIQPTTTYLDSKET